jgi:hypothetical protein
MNRKRHPLLDQHDVSACLHVARDLLHDRAKAERGPTKRRLKAIESAVFDAIGWLARQGLTSRKRAPRTRLCVCADRSGGPSGRPTAGGDVEWAVEALSSGPSCI